MLTGHQIREACELLWWRSSDLQRATKLASDVIGRVLTSDGPVEASPSEDAAFRRAFERAGLEFTKDGVRLRKANEP